MLVLQMLTVLSFTVVFLASVEGRMQPHIVFVFAIPACNPAEEAMARTEREKSDGSSSEDVNRGAEQQDEHLTSCTLTLRRSNCQACVLNVIF